MRQETATIQYLPDSKSILTYRGQRSFVIGGNNAVSKPFDQHSVGLFHVRVMLVHLQAPRMVY